MFILRETPDPVADLSRGWAAWRDQFEAHPLSLLAVSTIAASAGVIVPWLNEPAEAIRWCAETLGLDIRQCPATGLYGVCEYDGLPGLGLGSRSLKAAGDEAWELILAGLAAEQARNVLGLFPIRCYNVHCGWHIFEVEAICPL